MILGIVYLWSRTIPLDELEMYQFFAILSISASQTLNFFKKHFLIAFTKHSTFWKYTFSLWTFWKVNFFIIHFYKKLNQTHPYSHFYNDGFHFSQIHQLNKKIKSHRIHGYVASFFNLNPYFYFSFSFFLFLFFFSFSFDRPQTEWPLVIEIN